MLCEKIKSQKLLYFEGCDRNNSNGWLNLNNILRKSSMDLWIDYNTINHLKIKKLVVEDFGSELKESPFIQNYSDVY